jgi:hypothetical protein
MDLNASLTQIFDFGGNVASVRRRTQACDFANRVIFAQPDIPVLFWDGLAARAVELPGLVPGERFWGVNAFKDILLLWSGSRLKWSDSNNSSSWVPVAATATTFTFATLAAFTQLAPGVESDIIPVNTSPLGLVAGQFLFVDSAGGTSYFQVVQVLPVVGLTANLASFLQTVPAGQQADLFLMAGVLFPAGERLYFDGGTGDLEVTEDAVMPTSEILQLAADFVAPIVGGLVSVTVTTGPVQAAGGYVSIGNTTTPGQDIYQVQSVNTSEKLLTLRRIGAGLVASPYSHSAGQFIVGQAFVSVLNISATTAVTGTFLSTVNERYGFTMKAVDLTGAAAVGTAFPIGTQIFTLDANEAGEVINSGADVNGTIFQVVTLGEYAYILKNRSIQSVQYVGSGQGTFFTRPEVTDEGMIARYAFVKVGNDTLYFWGNREVYQYTGGNQISPIAQQYTKQLMAELDKSRADEIIGVHKEIDKEIWFIYPSILGTTRVFVFNYITNSCTIDDYTELRNGFTSAGRIDWSPFITWAQALGTWAAPGSWPVWASWADLDINTPAEYDLLATSIPEDESGSGESGESGSGEPTDLHAVLVHGAECYNRLGAAIPTRWESPDHDNGDPVLWKYPDTVLMEFQIKGTPLPGATIDIYLGTKLNLDDAVAWHGPKALRADTLSGKITRVNIPCSGKFFRLRCESDMADLQWRLTHYKILGRQGGAA